MVHRIYVEKRDGFNSQATALAAELRDILGVTGLQRLRILHRYDVEGLDAEQFGAAVAGVFSEPQVDQTYSELPQADHIFGVELLPGQFDQRADSAAECIQLMGAGVRPLVACAQIYLLYGPIGGSHFDAVRGHLINSVEARQASLEPLTSLRQAYPAPPDIQALEGFTELPDAQLEGYVTEHGLAMDAADLAVCRDYFKSEGRQPTQTELRVIDTYWSDHCRHTTFGTQLEQVEIQDTQVRKSWQTYLALRDELYTGNTKPITFMDLATIGARAVKARGGLKNLDESDEINACSVHIKADVSGTPEDWLLLFKNETHNHPTEIEPFGGAATCIGGVIRDPLANRGYVFGAMRVTGAGDPRVPLGNTLPGKLPQRTLCTTAAAGFSSYGNQIGLATGQVKEYYHPGFVAKRMELGAVLGAVPLANVRREQPSPGDVVLLVGGRTGRDGCGGATGSSKAHGAQSLESCGAEVQKGNAPVERKLQRLFRNPSAVRLIRRCNDFGAGGVSVAIGELADGLDIDLNAVPKKYDGLDGTELAISESQERMAVVVSPQDADAFAAFADGENLEATRVAVVTEAPRLVMRWRGQKIVDMARGFLASNGAQKKAAALVPPLPKPAPPPTKGGALAQRLRTLVASLDHCSQKGLAERFDATIGAGSVLMPFGGAHQLSPAQAMVMKLPVQGETNTCAGMAHGYNPHTAARNPYAGAYLAVVESVCRLAAAGFARADMTLSFQEYFERLRREPLRWGKPLAALLGGLQAQLDLGVAAIGGKDSMSGSFEQLDVPPTLVCFAVAAGDTRNVHPGEFQQPGCRVALLRPELDENGLPRPDSLKQVLDTLHSLITGNRLRSLRAVGAGGLAEALFHMCLGNRLGFAAASTLCENDLFTGGHGGFVLELEADVDAGIHLGETTSEYNFSALDQTVALDALQHDWEQVLEPVYPCLMPTTRQIVPTLNYEAECIKTPTVGCARPRALVPVFPGTNCEYDTAAALRRAGAEPHIFVVRDLTPRQAEESAGLLAKQLAQSQMLVLPGGFSGGDEPEGSAKLICALLRAPRVAQALADLLERRDGLVLGICNGFQALIKLGLVPYGRITPPTAHSPTLTFNAIGRHQSMLVRTRVASSRSPWLAKEPVGAQHIIAISHGEGRFVAEPQLLDQLVQNGQIVTQYVDPNGNPSMDVRYNPNGSILAVESICSPDGRVLGKMGHTERSGESLYVNVPGNKHQRLFEGGVDYFKL